MLHNNSFGYGHGIPMLNWQCYGNETQLMRCLMSDSLCFDAYYGLYNIAGVKCQGHVIASKQYINNNDSPNCL